MNGGMAIVAAVLFTAPALAAPRIEYAFSPQRSAAALVAQTIDNARTEVRLAAYSFTSRRIALALARAEARAVDVRVVMDHGRIGERGSVVRMLRRSGVALRSCRQFAIMHNKFMVVDGATVQTGSFNYTQAAEDRNAENVLVVHDRALAATYEAEWERIWRGCQTLR